MKRLLSVLALFLVYESMACTSAIVSSSLSRDGGVILWKHRDNSTHDTCVEYITGGKYAYTALINCFYGKNRGVYAGLNEVGFGLINTATRNLAKKKQLTATEECMEVNLTRFSSSLNMLGLACCATVDDFEELIGRLPRKHDFQTNIGVGDASGNAAYFEIWADGYRRYDVKEGSFDIRTNFSFAGDSSKTGTSRRRYDLMQQVMSAHKGPFTAMDFIQYSRSYQSIEFGDVLKNDKKYVDNNYTVVRRTSVASIVVVLGKNPHMLIINANPVVGVAVPVWVAQKNNLPKCLRPLSAQHQLSRVATKSLYTHLSKKSYLLNKTLARAIQKVNIPDIDLQQMPADITAFNAKVDKMVDAYLLKLKAIL